MDLKVYNDSNDKHLFTEEMVTFPLKKVEFDVIDTLTDWLAEHSEIDEDKGFEVVIDMDEGKELAEYAPVDNEKCPCKVDHETLKNRKKEVKKRNPAKKVPGDNK